VGVGAAFLGLFNALFGPTEEGSPSRSVMIFAVPALSFALFFALVFPLAYAFPPSADGASASLRFPGARKVVWPAIGVAAAAVVWWALSI
jgi:hypothetical protein